MCKNKKAEYVEKAKEILSQMSLDDKIHQMGIYENLNDAYDEFLENGKIELRAGTFAYYSAIDENKLNTLQNYCLKEVKPGIPLLQAAEAIHGVQDRNATVFPQCVGLGGSFDREAIEEMADVIGTEAREEMAWIFLIAPSI